MPSKYGGIPVEENAPASGSKFGGVPIESTPTTGEGILAQQGIHLEQPKPSLLNARQQRAIEGGPVDQTGNFDFGGIASGAHNLTQPGQRLHGIHQITSGVGQGVAVPAILGGALLNPVGTAIGLGGATVGSAGGRTLAGALGGGQGAQEVAGDVGGLALGGLGTKLPGTKAGAVVGGAAKGALREGLSPVNYGMHKLPIPQGLAGAAAGRFAGGMFGPVGQEIGTAIGGSAPFVRGAISGGRAAAESFGKPVTPEPFQYSVPPALSKRLPLPSPSKPAPPPEPNVQTQWKPLPLPRPSAPKPPSPPSGGTSAPAVAPKPAPSPSSGILDDIARSQAGKSFAKLTPDQQAKVQSLATKVQPSTPPTTAPTIGKPSMVKPIDVQLRDAMAQSSPEAKLTPEGKLQFGSGGTTENAWPGPNVFEESARNFKALDLAKLMHEQGVTPEILQQLDYKLPGPVQQYLQQSRGIKTQGISPQTVQMAAEEMKRMGKQ